jgi:N-acetylneuraminic acid mutarotase
MHKFFGVVFTLYLTIITAGYFAGCKKTDQGLTPGPITTTDSSLSIISTKKTDVNEFDVTCQVNPKSGKTYTNAQLYWSTDENFSLSRDSVMISPQIGQLFSSTTHLSGLKQHTAYYCRLAAMESGQQYFSPVASFKTDSLMITSAFGLDTFPILVNRNFDQNSLIWTNFSFSTPVLNPDTSKVRIYLGTHECPVTNDQGNIIFFHVPDNIPPDSTYGLTLIRKGISVTTVAGLTVARGVWYSEVPPVVPLCSNCGVLTNGIGFFGTCQSSTAGYMVGGSYFYGLSLPGANRPDDNGPYSVSVFDGATQQWSSVMPTNPRMYTNPICYYYNNGIYVIGGQLEYPQDGPFYVNTMWRMDLGTNTWSPVGSLPYEGVFNQASFQLNGEWYIGMGADTVLVGGYPTPNKKFWKYTPASDTWTSLADYPGAVDENYPTCFTIGNQAYVFYGALISPSDEAASLSDYSQELWKYDPAANSWTQIPIPAGGPPPGEKYQIISYNGKAYFLSAQVRVLLGQYYGYLLEIPALEWDPVSNTYTRVSNAITGGILKLIYNSNDQFYFQSDAQGYIDNMPDSTSLFVPDR